MRTQFASSLFYAITASGSFGAAVRFVVGMQDTMLYLPQAANGKVCPTSANFFLHLHLAEFDSEPRIHQRKKRAALRLFALVDPRRIELLSENPFTGLSSWVVCDLEFPLGVGHRQPTPVGSPFLHDRYKCELPMHVHHSMTLSPRSWSSPGERAAKKPRHCP